MEIVRYLRSFDRSAFDCGVPELNEWLQTQATQQEKANNTRTFLAVEDDQVVGYYASTTYRLELDEVATMYGAGSRQYPIPAVLLARLAVDKRAHGRGVGTAMLVHALGEFAAAAQSVGFEVVVVHAIDHDAVTFYARAGFQQFHSQPLHLFMPTKDVIRTMNHG